MFRTRTVFPLVFAAAGFLVAARDRAPNRAGATDGGFTVELEPQNARTTLTHMPGVVLATLYGDT